MAHAPSLLIDALKAAGEPTRLRILTLLQQGELSVGELVQILDQSQPRLSHHLKTLTQGGLVQRFPEGAWVFYRLSRQQPAQNLLQAIFSVLDTESAPFNADREALNHVRQARSESAEKFFADIASRWDKLRGMHFPETEIEAAVLAAAGHGPFERVVDLGTGTGRMMILFGDRANEIEGLDLSHQMLTLARANLVEGGIANAHVRHGHVEQAPFQAGSADLIIVHQVLHYLEAPDLALREAARILQAEGCLLVIDFAPHEMEFLRESAGHRRLGIRTEDMVEWLNQAGLELEQTQSFEPPSELEEGLEVKLWKIRKPPIAEGARP